MRVRRGRLRACEGAVREAACVRDGRGGACGAYHWESVSPSVAAAAVALSAAACAAAGFFGLAAGDLPLVAAACQHGSSPA